ncbi:MAG: OmpA family protein [Cyclobacteriaceae bacterium]
MRLIYLVIILVSFASCSKPLLVSHLFSAENYWKSKREKKIKAAFDTYGGPSHTALSPVICWDEKCRYRKKWENGKGTKFKGYKKGGPPKKLPKHTPDEVEELIAEEVQTDTIATGLAKNEPANYGLNQSYIFQKLNFDINQSIIKSDSYGELDKIARHLTENPHLKIKITGHTDSSGEEVFNEKLSLNRAKNVFEYFKTKGINENRMQYLGVGSSMPLIIDHLDHEENRRVEFEFFED